jgi:hypothetical protein
MAKELDLVGDRVDLKFRRGEQRIFTHRDFLGDDGQPITTISQARIKFCSGSFLNPGLAVDGVSITPTTDGESVTWTLTKTLSRAFTAGGSYCYFFEVEYTDGTVQAIQYGKVTVWPEGVE